MNNMYKTYIGMVCNDINKKHLFYRREVILKYLQKHSNLDAVYTLFDCELSLLLLDWMKDVPNSTFERILKNDQNLR